MLNISISKRIGSTEIYKKVSFFPIYDMKKELKTLDTYLQDAIQNIEEDRAVTKILLLDVIQYVKNSKDNHKDIGHIAAKYVETLQRSNEQLVKIASLLQKKSTESQNLSDKDKDELFDMIRER